MSKIDFLLIFKASTCKTPHPPSVQRTLYVKKWICVPSLSLTPDHSLSIFQKRTMFEASFLSCTVGEVSATDNALSFADFTALLLLVTRLRAFIYYFLFRHLVNVSEQIGVLYDSGRTKVAKKKQPIWLFSQSNRNIDLNQPVSAKPGNSSSSFYDEGNIQRSLELENKETTKQSKKRN